MIEADLGADAELWENEGRGRERSSSWEKSPWNVPRAPFVSVSPSVVQALTTLSTTACLYINSRIAKTLVVHPPEQRTK